MIKFQVIISETETGLSLEIKDYESKQKASMDYGEEKHSILSVAGMSDFVLKKCKEIIRMTPEEMNKKKEELSEPLLKNKL